MTRKREKPRKIDAAYLRGLAAMIEARLAVIGPEALIETLKANESADYAHEGGIHGIRMHGLRVNSVTSAGQMLVEWAAFARSEANRRDHLAAAERARR